MTAHDCKNCNLCNHQGERMEQFKDKIMTSWAVLQNEYETLSKRWHGKAMTDEQKYAFEWIERSIREQDICDLDKAIWKAKRVGLL